MPPPGVETRRKRRTLAGSHVLTYPAVLPSVDGLISSPRAIRPLGDLNGGLFSLTRFKLEADSIGD